LNPGTKNSRVFVLGIKEKESLKENKIDFTKLNDRIIEQAYEASGFILNNKQRTELLQRKIDRASDAIEHRKKFPAYAD
jgi:hypothetical protein